VNAAGAARLVVCPTPIGNLEDVTLRVLAALRDADVVACEDTRRTRVLLDRYGVRAKLVSYHEHNERPRATELVKRIGAGVPAFIYGGLRRIAQFRAERRGGYLRVQNLKLDRRLDRILAFSGRGE